MSSEVLETGIEVTAVGLTLGSLVLLLNGRAHALGLSFRSTVEPPLRSIRNHTALSRSELADRTLLAGIALAGFGALFDRPLAGVLLIGLLLWSRPFVRRATREENRLMAVAGNFSADLMIGVYVPVVLAQLILANFFLAASLAAVIIALSWPTGFGQAVPGRTWRLAPVPVR